MLLQSIGEKRLTGFQIGIYLLGLVTIILGGVGVGISAAHSSWKIGSVNIQWIFIVTALLIFGIMVYFDRNLPGKNYRKSNLYIEIIVEVFFLICICSGSIFSARNVDNMIEKIIFFLIMAAIVGPSLAIRIIGARRNREEN